MSKILRSGFRSVVLVCKACEKRSKGPAGLKAKDVARQLKGAARTARVERARVVLTSCLGACPKKAMTLAALRPGRETTMVALGRKDRLDDAAAALFGPPAQPEVAGAPVAAPAVT